MTPGRDCLQLEHECAVFTRCLIGVPPTGQVVSAYVDAHRRSGAFTADGDPAAWLVALARRGPFRARLADAYARRFAPRGVLRRKLVLLLAILETSSPSFRVIDYDRPSSPGVAVLRLAAVGTAGVLTAVFAVATLVPLKWLRRGRSR